MAGNLLTNYFILYFAFVCLALSIYVWMRTRKKAKLLEKKRIEDAQKIQLN